MLSKATLHNFNLLSVDFSFLSIYIAKQTVRSINFDCDLIKL